MLNIINKMNKNKINKMGFQIPLRYHFIPTRNAILKLTENNKHRYGCGETGTIKHC